MAPACPPTLADLRINEGFSPTINAPSEFTTYSLTCPYGSDTPTGGFSTNRARASIRWSEPGAPAPAVLLRCGTDPLVIPGDPGEIGNVSIPSATTLATASYDGEVAYEGPISALALALLAQVEAAAQRCDPAVYCPPAPDGMRLHLRAAEVELREEIGHAKYDCAYAPADSGASALGFQVQGNWGYIESNRWPGYFCNPDFTSSGPSWSSEFEDVVFSLDQAASVRYLGGGFPEAVARQMATEILGVIEERGVACAGSDAGAAAAPAAVASPASDSSDGSGSAAGASTPGSDDSSGGAASSGGGESSGGAAGGGTTAGEGDALTTEQSSDEGGPFAGFVLGDGPVDVSAEEAAVAAVAGTALLGITALILIWAQGGAASTLEDAADALADALGLGGDAGVDDELVTMDVEGRTNAPLAGRGSGGRPPTSSRVPSASTTAGQASTPATSRRRTCARWSRRCTSVTSDSWRRWRRRTHPDSRSDGGPGRQAGSASVFSRARTDRGRQPLPCAGRG